jgi:hypothetical protein
MPWPAVADPEVAAVRAAEVADPDPRRAQMGGREAVDDA